VTGCFKRSLTKAALFHFQIFPDSITKNFPENGATGCVQTEAGILGPVRVIRNVPVAKTIRQTADLNVDSWKHLSINTADCEV
jgi:hypothetical protein